jgi:polysaccharide export outer membrane protein
MHAYLRRIWLALLLAFAGCSPSSGLPVLAAKPEVWAYRLGPGDTLQIRVLSANELNGQYLVQDDGTVRMLMAGAIPAAGFTAEQVQTKIEDALKAGRFLTQPRVTVAVVNYRPYFILGEVSGPGAYPYVNGMRVLSAVAAAGGYTRRADQNFVIITRNGEDYRADFMAFIQPDDTIRVYERYLFANRIEFNGDFHFDGERLGRWRVSENRHPTQ